MTARTLLLALLIGALIWLALLWSLTEKADIQVTTTDDSMAFTPTLPATTSSTTTTLPPTTTTAAPTTTTTPKARTAPIARPATVAVTGSIPDAIRAGFSRFGAHVAEQAVKVSGCETGGTFSPGSTGSQGERGLFQIHPKYHQERIRRLGFTWDRMYEVGPNIAVAADLYAASGWGPWTCRSAL